MSEMDCYERLLVKAGTQRQWEAVDLIKQAMDKREANMITDSVDVDMAKVMKDMTITVKVFNVRRTLMRFKIALLFFKIGAWLGGFGIKVVDEEEEEGSLT